MNTPFYKTGPLYAHEAGHIDPTEEAKAKAEAKKKAEANASKGKKVYGKTTRTKTTSDTGVTTHTASTPYTTSGSGDATTKKSYKQLKAEGGDVEAAKKFNASATSSGVKTRSYKTFNITPRPMAPMGNLTPTASINIPKPPKPSRPAPPKLGGTGGSSMRIRIGKPTFTLSGLSTGSGGGGKPTCGCK